MLVVTVGQGADDVVAARAPLFELLVEKGLSIDSRDNAGVTSLMMATDQGKTHFVRYLLEHGAQVSVRDQAGNTAIEYAERKQRDEILRILRDPAGKTKS